MKSLVTPCRFAHGMRRAIDCQRKQSGSTLAVLVRRLRIPSAMIGKNSRNMPGSIGTPHSVRMTSV